MVFQGDQVCGGVAEVGAAEEVLEDWRGSVLAAVDKMGTAVVVDIESP